MHVRVHVTRRNVEEHDAVRMTAEHRVGSVAARPRAGQHRAAHEPAVDEEQLHAAVGPVRAGRAHVAAQAAAEHARRRRVERQQRFGRAPPEDHREPLALVAARRHHPHVLAVVAQHERPLRIGQREAREPGGDPVELGRRGAQVLAAHGDVGEELLRADRRTDRCGVRLGRTHVLGVRPHSRADRVAAAARDDLHSRDGRDRCQSLAPEPERRDGFQLGRLVQLAGRVTEHGERELARRHAGAVVNDFDRIEAAALDGHRDPRRARVHCVLDELFDDRCRPLDDFTRGNLTDRHRVELSDRGHARYFARAS